MDPYLSMSCRHCDLMVISHWVVTIYGSLQFVFIRESPGCLQNVVWLLWDSYVFCVSHRGLQPCRLSFESVQNNCATVFLLKWSQYCCGYIHRISNLPEFWHWCLWHISRTLNEYFWLLHVSSSFTESIWGNCLSVQTKLDKQLLLETLVHICSSS